MQLKWIPIDFCVVVMSWLKGRRRTLDIVNEVSEFESQNKSAVMATTTTGAYNNNNVVQPPTNDENSSDCDDDNVFTTDSSTTMTTTTTTDNSSTTNETKTPGDTTDKLTNGECDINSVENSEVGSRNSEPADNCSNNYSETNGVNNSEHTNNRTEPTSILKKSDTNNNNHRDFNDNQNGVTSSQQVSDNSSEAVSCDDIVLLESNNIHDEVDRTTSDPYNTNDVNDTDMDMDMDDAAVEAAFKKSSSCKPRCSLDSRMQGLLKSTTKGRTSSHQSVSSISECDEDDLHMERKPRKSISWAEDLESIHEFEKIKPRRMSLVNLFKKL